MLSPILFDGDFFLNSAVAVRAKMRISVHDAVWLATVHVRPTDLAQVDVEAAAGQAMTYGRFELSVARLRHYRDAVQRLRRVQRVRHFRYAAVGVSQFCPRMIISRSGRVSLILIAVSLLFLATSRRGRGRGGPNYGGTGAGGRRRRTGLRRPHLEGEALSTGCGAATSAR